MSVPTDAIVGSPADTTVGSPTDTTVGSPTETTVGSPTGVNVGPLTAIPPGEGRAFAVGDNQVAIFRSRTGRLYALGAACPHRGGPLADGQIDGRVVLCPLHANAFELATGCSTTGADPVPTWEVAVDQAGDVIVGARRT